MAPESTLSVKKQLEKQLERADTTTTTTTTEEQVGGVRGEKKAPAPSLFVELERDPDIQVSIGGHFLLSPYVYYREVQLQRGVHYREVQLQRICREMSQLSKLPIRVLYSGRSTNHSQKPDSPETCLLVLILKR